MTMTQEQLAEVRRVAESATHGDRFVGGPYPAVTVCIGISPRYWDGRPESYDPGECEPLQEFWPSNRGEAPANVKADAELFAKLDPATVISLLDQLADRERENAALRAALSRHLSPTACDYRGGTHCITHGDARQCRHEVTRGLLEGGR